MLILSRKLGESIVIDDDIQVRILGINGNQVRVGIDAPKNIAVHREEIHQKIANQASVKQPNKNVDSDRLQSQSKIRSFSEATPRQSNT